MESGGANGIGRATVEHLNGPRHPSQSLYSNPIANTYKDLGASVVFGDLNCPAGEALASTSPRILFVPTDVTSYLSLLNLFRTAYALHSRLDHAISSAGIMEIGTLFDGDLDDEASIEKPPSTAVLDVSLLGSYYFLRVAVYYLRKSKRDWGVEQRDASLVLVSSTAGFHSYNGLCGYSASKHGIMGLLRSTKNFLEPAEGIRVNAVQPNAVRESDASAYMSFGAWPLFCRLLTSLTRQELRWLRPL